MVGYQDNIKKAHKLSFKERINIQYNTEAKQSIKEQIRSNSQSKLPFQFSSMSVSNRVNEILVTTEKSREEIYMQLATLHLIKKLHVSSLELVDF